MITGVTLAVLRVEGTWPVNIDELMILVIGSTRTSRQSFQGCCLTGARSPGAPWLRARATKVLYKEPERAPNFITKAIDPNFVVNYIPVAGHNTVKVLMYLASVSTRETCKNSQTIST